MSMLNWSDMLVAPESLTMMPAERLEALRLASDNQMHTLAHGVSGIGNLLACTASNGDTGLNADAVAHIGWMLESLGGLISNLSDTAVNAEYQIEKAAGKRKGAAK